MSAVALAMGIAQLIGPEIVGLFAGDKGEAVAEKVVGIASLVTGHKDPAAALDVLQADPAAAAEFSKRLQDNAQELKRLAFADKANARAMYASQHTMADRIAARVTDWNLPTLLLLLLVNVAAGIWVPDPVVVQVMATLIGGACQHLWQERRTIIEFYFGAGLANETAAQNAMGPSPGP